VVREKSGKKGKVRESVFLHMVNTASIDLDTKCAKKELFTGKVVHYMKSERRKDAYCALQDASCV